MTIGIMKLMMFWTESWWLNEICEGSKHKENRPGRTNALRSLMRMERGEVREFEVVAPYNFEPPLNMCLNVFRRLSVEIGKQRQCSLPGVTFASMKNMTTPMRYPPFFTLGPKTGAVEPPRDLHNGRLSSVGLVRYHGREEGHQCKGVEVVPVNVIIIGLIE
ncbi:hypothetical protein F2Q68_00031610 [Brassica cretica]|uniref:Uncharacterized protein n=1 Tax=Brassica cretica TaxID=69181 RepID=A0A8S9GAM1_BRACR|nr:hypothetical protein F2Q68_00031610 [Brassica cretica]